MNEDKNQNKKELKQGEFKYEFCIYKRKGHKTWRFTTLLDLDTNLQAIGITAQKKITIDRLTGEVVVLDI